MSGEPPYAGLTPDAILDALAAVGFEATAGCSP